jgi:hypothetical protein
LFYINIFARHRRMIGIERVIFAALQRDFSFKLGQHKFLAPVAAMPMPGFPPRGKWFQDGGASAGRLMCHRRPNMG